MDVDQAEIQAVKMELSIAWEMRTPKLTIEMDSGNAYACFIIGVS